MHGGGGSRVDLNRAGTPLVEIVSEPDMAGAAEARSYLERLKLLLTYLGVSDCNMQEGSLRCDVNVNFKVETDDGVKPTPIAEVKNLNSFRGVEAAIEFERTRQLEEFARTGETLNAGNKTTRGWDPDRQVTVPQRTKEEAADYRYFPDPDLVPVTLTDDAIEALRADLGEFPADRRLRIADVWGLNEYDANVVIERGKDFADYFEEVAQTADDGKRAANWCTQDVLRDLSELDHTLDSFPIPAGTLGHLLGRVAAGELNTKAARDVYADLLARPRAENTPRDGRRDRRRARPDRRERRGGIGGGRRRRDFEPEERRRRRDCPRRQTAGRRPADGAGARDRQRGGPPRPSARCCWTGSGRRGAGRPYARLASNPSASSSSH